MTSRFFFARSLLFLRLQNAFANVHQRTLYGFFFRLPVVVVLNRKFRVHSSAFATEFSSIRPNITENPSETTVYSMSIKGCVLEQPGRLVDWSLASD